MSLRILRPCELSGSQFTAASFLPLLKKGADNTTGYTSQIINTTSISGLMKGASGGQFAYVASKEAMVQVRAIAVVSPEPGMTNVV